jgi:hypothetical protein
MPTYFTEHGSCFPGRKTTYELESNTCMARDDASEALLLAPWSDGGWWLDLDGTEVGWLELDGSYYPPPDGIRPL